MQAIRADVYFLIDLLMSGNCYSGANKNLQSKFKERGATIDKMSKEVKELRQEIKTLKASLADTKRRSGKPGNVGGGSGAAKPAGGQRGGARTLKERIDGESRGLEYLNGKMTAIVDL